MTGRIASTPALSTLPPVSSAPRASAPAKASDASSSIPTPLKGMQPMSVGSLAFPSKPDGVTSKQFEKEATFKQVGDPKKNGVALGRAAVNGESYFDANPQGLQTQAKGQAALTAAAGRFEYAHQGRLGTTQAHGEFEVGAKVKGEAGAKLSKPDLSLVGQASAEGFAGARGELHLEQKQGRHFSQTLDGSVKAGASANAGATFAFDPKHGTAMAKVGFGAMAGAQESASGELKLGVVRLSAGISAQQGVSSSFGMGAGIQDGRAMVSFNAGAALGLGASVNVGVAVNTQAIAHNAHAAGHKVKDAAHTAGHKVKDAAHAAGHKVKDAAYTVKDGARQLGHAIHA